MHLEAVGAWGGRNRHYRSLLAIVLGYRFHSFRLITIEQGILIVCRFVGANLIPLLCRKGVTVGT
jgi:hypothetical protein